MVLNTTNGPREAPRGHVVNTSRILEEELTYEDEEPEILAVFSGTDWTAVVVDKRLTLVAFVALDDAKMYGVAVGEDGHIDLIAGSVEDLPVSVGYEQASTNEKENENG